MTILIGKDNQAQCYMGQLGTQTPSRIALGDGKLRKEIAVRNKQAHDYSAAKGAPEKGLIVLIKPGKHSNYGNLVDVLDEMAIADIGTYAITDVDAAEQQFLQMP